MSLCSFLGILWAFWIWICLSIPRLETFSAIISSGKFSAPFSFWNPYKVNVGLLDIVSWFFLAVFTLFSLVSFCCSDFLVSLLCVWVHWSSPCWRMYILRVQYILAVYFIFKFVPLNSLPLNCLSPLPSHHW